MYSYEWELLCCEGCDFELNKELFWMINRICKL